jgi:hypothetical protein
MSHRHLNLKWIVAALCLCGTHSVLAATATSTFTVSSTISATCSTPSAGNLDFGTYNPIGGSSATATATITITCTNTTTITSVTLNAGTGTGTINARKMEKNGTDSTKTLNYNLYTTSGNASIWGDGTSGNVTNNVSGSAGTGSAQTLTVYGTIPANQTSVEPGSYSDTITVTINY